MNQLKQIQNQNVFRGEIDFAAATEGEILLPKGRWTAGQFAFHAHPLVRHRDVITITAVNSTVYTVTIDGVEYAITSDASATTAEIRDALEAEIDAASPGNGVVGEDVDADELAIVALEAGVRHKITVGANLVLAEGIDTPPTFGIFHDPTEGKLIVRTAAAFTGKFIVTAMG